MSVGNDVVDLACPETRLDDLHPRFVERVFGPSERSALDTGPDRRVRHWASWAAKESAYKALKRVEPATVFSPMAFEVELREWPPERGVAVGRVRHRGVTLALEVRLAGECLHAVAAAGVAAEAVRSGTGPAGADPSRSARDLAVAALAPALGLDPRELAIDGRPPVVRRGDERLDVILSLSHHGRFVAFAFAAWP
ncbi:MAG TPA: 4'-phosphopantetheinyl transferase superfamily protein [Vicinamibacteria bacterium]|nr:4'-phosphopantetheinyl transferase superfamily protein [Vicinamibacteria bacterium]